MNTLPIGRYRFFQTLQPLSLLTQITSQPTNGCLQIFSPSASWLFYFKGGKLIYACYAEKMFDILYRTLQRLSKHIPTLHHGIYKQLRVIFETGIENQAIPNPDYLAICWLVKQKYLTPAQAGILIEQLTLEVMQSFLKLKEGSYEFTPRSFLDDMPKFCYLEMRLVVENCQKRSRNSANLNSQVTQQQRVRSFNQQTRQSQTSSEQQFSRNNSDLLPDVKATGNHRQQVSQQSFTKKNHKIFCVSDSPIVLKNLKNYLDEENFSLVGINNPVKALLQILHVKPDIILLDIDIPNLNGYEFCSLLRKHLYFQNTPVIIITERQGLINRVKTKVARASGYLVKPFTQADLLKVIFQHIR
ncbi:MAG: response regulator [Stigonema ocellatum SAG 48.90 = DSM 106950]|nr:response regulator [Stigonema ocellatum SAG 48.90 = DSM 106950]